MSGIRRDTKQLLNEATREDVSTGSTPKKRKWEYVENWDLTRDRDAILSDWRQTVQTDQKQPSPESEEVEDAPDREHKLPIEQENIPLLIELNDRPPPITTTARHGHYEAVAQHDPPMKPPSQRVGDVPPKRARLASNLPPPTGWKGKGKLSDVGLPIGGPLTERSVNVVSNGRPRRGAR